MAAELKVSGRMTVKRLKENFKNEFEGTLRVYNGREKADDNATLASIRRNNDAKGGELVCNGNLTVGSFEKKMLEVFGIKVQVATPDDWMLALDGITLAKLKDIPEKTSKADMESLVAYKRKTKATDEIVENDVDDSLDNNIELSDISKKAAIFLSFTQNEDDEFYCYLHNIIKDGALYCVGENLGEIDCSAVENYDASEYDCCSENIEDEYADVESLAEQLVNDFVEARYDECEQDNGAMAIDDEYTITIFVGDNKVYEQTVCKSVESGNGWTDFDDDEKKSTNCKAPKTKQVRLAIFAAQQPRLISLQTLCEDDMEVVDENGASVETYEHLVDHGSGEWVNLAFVPSGCCVELNVTNPDADDDDDDEYRLYSDDEFEVCPNYGMMNMQEAKENYEDDSASIERYTAYLNVEMGEDYDRLTNKGLKVAWERLKTNEVNAESYVPAVMQYVISEEGGDKAFLRGLQVEDITMAFNIDIPEGEEFDPSKLDFINMDAEYEDNSEVLSELLAADMVLLNAIIYDGKMYFADGYEDVTEDSWGDAEYYYDIVDAASSAANNIDKVESEVEENDDNISEEEYPLIEKLREAFIVETDDEVYYDAESADEYTQDQFINNIKAQMTDDEVEAFESLQWKGAEAFTNYLEDCPDDFDLRQMIITAAYCTRQCMDIDDDTRLYVDEQLYYFNDCRDFHHKYEADIDLG